MINFVQGACGDIMAALLALVSSPHGVRDLGAVD
jgi:hypothetical protein